MVLDGRHVGGAVNIAQVECSWQRTVCVRRRVVGGRRVARTDATVRARRGHSIELHTSRQIERIVQTRDRVRAVCVRRYGMPGHRQDKCKKRYLGTYRATTA